MYKSLDVLNSGGGVVPNSVVYKYSDPGKAVTVNMGGGSEGAKRGRTKTYTRASLNDKKLLLYRAVKLSRAELHTHLLPEPERTRGAHCMHLSRSYRF